MQGTRSVFVLAALGAAVCACERTVYLPAGTGSDAPSAAPAPAASTQNQTTDVRVDVDLTPPAPQIVYVEADTYPQREYFYEPNDVEHVYFYESSAPDVVVYRQVMRDRDRVFFVDWDRDRGVERRVYFDDRAARARQWNREAQERRRLENEARSRWQQEHEAWESTWRERRERWERDHRRFAERSRDEAADRERAERDRLERERLERERREREHKDGR